MTVAPLCLCFLLNLPMPALFVIEEALSGSPSEAVTVSQCETGCPSDEEWARGMVEGLLEDPRRQFETQTEGISAADVEIVQDSSTCIQLAAVTPEFHLPDYIESYYQAGTGTGRRYFVVWTRQPPEDPNVILYATSFIVVLDEDFDFLGGYMW